LEHIVVSNMVKHLEIHDIVDCQEKLWNTINLPYTRVNQPSPLWNTKWLINSLLL
jgi:hypothetical protein